MGEWKGEHKMRTELRNEVRKGPTKNHGGSGKLKRKRSLKKIEAPEYTPIRVYSGSNVRFYCALGQWPYPFCVCITKCSVKE